MLLVDRAWQSTTTYKYGFNGKENVDDVYGNDVANDFGARIYDARIVKWLSVDMLYNQYPCISPFVFCLNNPIIFKDPNGKQVHPMSDEALEIIKYGLTPEESKYITLDEYGFIDKAMIEKGSAELTSVGGNFSALLTIVKDERILEIYVQQTFETQSKTTDMGQARYESELDAMWEIEKQVWEDAGKTKEDYIAAHPYYSTEKSWSGIFGITIMPDIDPTEYYGISKSGNIEVYINDSPLKADAGEGLKKMTSTNAHEAYGHVLFAFLGKNANHGSKKSLTSDSEENNKELEIQIYDREQEAEKNYDLHDQ